MFTRGYYPRQEGWWLDLALFELDQENGGGPPVVAMAWMTGATLETSKPLEVIQDGCCPIHLRLQLARVGGSQCWLWLEPGIEVSFITISKKIEKRSFTIFMGIYFSIFFWDYYFFFDGTTWEHHGF